MNSRVVDFLKVRGGQFFDRPIARPLARVIGVTARVLLPPVLNCVLRLRVWQRITIDGRADFFVRGSLLDLSDYNPFFSDWDIGLVISDECLRDETWDENRRRILDRIQKLRKIIPPLGELEIYSRTEKQELDEIQNEIGPFYRRLRSLRKIKWVEDKLSEASGSVYQTVKARRGLQRCYARLGLAIEETFHSDGWIRALNEVSDFAIQEFGEAEVEGFDPEGREIYQPYLDRNVPTAALSRRQLVVLFSVLPPLKIENSSLESAVLQARRALRIRRACERLSRGEELIVQGVMRTFLRSDAGYEKWLEALHLCSRALRD